MGQIAYFLREESLILKVQLAERSSVCYFIKNECDVQEGVVLKSQIFA